MPTPIKTEFSVKMSCDSCVNTVTKALKGIDGIDSFDINLKNQQVIINSSLPVFKLQQVIESTGRQAVLKGAGIANTENRLGAAVAAIDTGEKVKGIIRIVQATPESCIIEGTLDGLLPGKNTVCIHQFGDLSDGCNSCGDVYGITKSFNEKIVGNIQTVDASSDGRATFQKEVENMKLSQLIRRSVVVHEGDLDSLKLGNSRSCGDVYGITKSFNEKIVGNIQTVDASSDGRATFQKEVENMKLSQLIGRSVVVHEGDLDSLKLGNSRRVGCGIIARSAGIFENAKMFCACDGVSIWDEREKPVAGPGRSNKMPNAKI